MLCAWWNFKGIINHFEHVQNGPVNDGALYSEQLDDRVYTAVAARNPDLLNGKHALRQHDNTPPAHTAPHIKAKVKELPTIPFFTQPAFGPNHILSDL